MGKKPNFRPCGESCVGAFVLNPLDLVGRWLGFVIKMKGFNISAAKLGRSTLKKLEDEHKKKVSYECHKYLSATGGRGTHKAGIPGVRRDFRGWLQASHLGKRRRRENWCGR